MDPGDKGLPFAPLQRIGWDLGALGLTPFPRVTGVVLSRP